MHSQVPPPNQVGEISQEDLSRQNYEQDLTRSNWRYFRAMTSGLLPGDGRRDSEPDTEPTPKYPNQTPNGQP